MEEVRSRRSMLKAGAGAALAFPMVNFGQHSVFASSSRRYSTRAIDLVKRSLVLDMLGMTRLDFLPGGWSKRLTEDQAAEFRASGINGMHHAPTENEGGLDPHIEGLRYFGAWGGFAARHSDLFIVVDRAADFDRAKREGKIALMHGIQNASHFRTPDDVMLFHSFGQRCSQLTYNRQNLLGAGGAERVDGGVTDFGASIIEAMNKTGMLVDLSHCGDRTTLDGITLSSKPVAITHANSRAVAPHPRNKTDEAIERLASKGGVLGVAGVRTFVRDREPTNVEHLVDHIDHVVRLVGVDHVGVGSDIDLHGYDDMPANQNAMMRAANPSGYREKIDVDGFDHPQRTYDLVEALIRRKYTDKQIQLVVGGNFRRLVEAACG
jgi:membrane dipeptidase